MTYKMIIKSIHEFEYSNGVKQKKYLISAEDWHNRVKPILEAIADEKELPEKRQSRSKLKKLNTGLNNLIGDIDTFYELIVEGGRYARALQTDILPPFFDGDIERPVKINSREFIRK